jgi:thiopeptide-type bacteriocin biosynthesis protein
VLLGRFCHADPELEEQVRAHIRAEEALRPEVTFAEIVHLPEGRTGNVLHRPVLRDHEIVFLGRSGAPEDGQLLVDDLRVSVRGPRIVLRSHRLGREIAPRLTNAHNFSAPRNLSAYRFLCTLAHEATAGAMWSWGALDSAPYLPRVRIGKTIVALRRWRVRKDELAGAAAAAGADRFAAVQRLRAARRLPRHVLVADGDNELPIDLDNAVSVDTFVHLTRERGEFTLTETLAGNVARGPEGRFVHEVVVPFVRAPRPRPPTPAVAAAPAERRFVPGSRWLYMKLYGGPAGGDEVLTSAIAPLLLRPGFAAAVDRWFFIRYADPDPHVRVRFHGDPAALSGYVRPVVDEALAPLLADGRLWRVQLDTYEREVERYGGGDGVDLAEDLFRADSDAVVALVGELAGDSGADRRWRLALVGMDRLLDDLGLDVAAKLDVSRRAREAFRAELAIGAPFDRQLGDKFRKLRLELERLLAEDTPAPFVARSRALAPVVAALRRCEADGRLTAPVVDLAPSYLHMHVNRLLRSQQRAQEAILYDFLCRLYEGRLARERKKR